MPPTIYMTNEREIDHESGEDVKQLTVLNRKIPGEKKFILLSN